MQRLAYRQDTRPVFGTAELLLSAANAAYKRARSASVYRGPWRARHAGAETPLWNLLRTELRRALRRRGAKTGLARYLGLPRQRVTDFVSARRRMPDAEITLRLLHWLEYWKRGRDLCA